MPWLFEGNAAHLTQYGFHVLDPLPTAVDPWGGVWTTSTTTVLSSWEVPSTSGGFPFGGWSSSGLSLQFAWVFDIGGGTVSGSLDNLTADGGHQGTSSLWPDTAPSPPPPNDLDSPLGGSSPAALTTADWISAGFLHGVDGNIVEGPYLIADSLASVKEDQAFRTSNQVPCAVFDGDGDSPDLFVYYVVESSVRGKATYIYPPMPAPRASMEVLDSLPP